VQPTSRKKNYSGFSQPVADRLGLLRRHATHLHLDAWRKGKQLNTWASGCFREFSGNNPRIARGFARELLWSSLRYRPGKSLKRRGKSSGLHSKNIFAWGLWFFVSDVISGGLLGHLGPLTWPGGQRLDCSISLKFLLETRLQSESFDTLDDLLGFRVEKLWPEVMKIFD